MRSLGEMSVGHVSLMNSDIEAPEMKYCAHGNPIGINTRGCDKCKKIMKAPVKRKTDKVKSWCR